MAPVDDFGNFIKCLKVGNVITVETLDKLKDYQSKLVSSNGGDRSLTCKCDFSNRGYVFFFVALCILTLSQATVSVQIFVGSGYGEVGKVGLAFAFFLLSVFSFLFVEWVAIKPVFMSEVESLAELLKQCLIDDSKLRNVIRAIVYLIILFIRLGMFGYVSVYPNEPYTLDLTFVPALGECVYFFCELFLKKSEPKTDDDNEECTSHPAQILHHRCSGRVEEFGGLISYVTGPRDSERAVVMICDVFGFKGLKLSPASKGPRLWELADKVAQCGFLVVVPDFFRGDPINDSRAHSNITEWLNVHDPDKGCEDAKAVIAALKSKGVAAIGAAGFCWGGMTVLKLAKSDCIQAAIVLHPDQISVDDIKGIKVPTALLGAEIDYFCPAEHLTNLGSILAAKRKVDNFLKIYPVVNHGWTLTYDDSDESAVKMAEAAHEDQMNWLNLHVK